MIFVFLTLAEKSLHVPKKLKTSTATGRKKSLKSEIIYYDSVLIELISGCTCILVITND